MKKMVFKVAMEDERSKRRAMKAVAGAGVDSIAVDMKEGKITAVGEADPVRVATKLRRLGYRAELLSLGPAKEEKNDPKEEKNDAKEEDQKKKKVVEPAPPMVVYDAKPCGYVPEGYSYTIVREEYSSPCTIL